MADALNAGAPWPTITVAIGDDGSGGKPRTEAANHERRQASRKRRSQMSKLVRKVMRLRATRDMRRVVAGGIAQARMVAMGATGAGVSASTTLARSMGGGPVGWVAAAIGLMSVAAVRGLSGRSFEGMSLEIENVLYGENVEEAMATLEARDTLTGANHVLRVVDARGNSNGDDLGRIMDMQRTISRQRIRGEREIRRHLDVNSPMDLLALRLWEAMKSACSPPEMERVLLNAIRFVVTKQSNPLAVGPNFGLKMGMAIGRAIGAR